MAADRMDVASERKQGGHGKPRNFIVRTHFKEKYCMHVYKTRVKPGVNRNFFTPSG